MLPRLHRSPLRIMPLLLALGLNAVLGAVGTVVVQANHAPSLTIQKTPDGGSVNAGDAITFTITVTNTTNAGSNATHIATATANNVDIDDTLPTGFSWNTSTPGCSVTGSPQALHCDVAALAPSGGSFTATVSSPTDTDDCGTKNNTATADADNHALVSNGGSVTIVCPDASVTKSAQSASVAVGSNAVYAVTVTAVQGGTSQDVVLTDDLPDGQTWAIADADGSGDGDDTAGCTVDSGSLAASTGTLTCDYGDLAQAATRSLTLTAATDSTDCGSISNTATLTPRSDANGANDTAGPVVISVICPDVHVTKESSEETVTAPQNYTYTITATNDTQGVAATGVVVTDDLDDDLVVVSATYDVDPGGVETPCSPTGSGNTISCSVGTLAGSDNNTTGAEADTVEVTITVTALPAACGVVTNEAHVSATNEATADQTDNSSGQVAVTVNCPPDVHVSKSASATAVTADEAYSYTITATNDTPGTASDVEVNDDLADEITISGDVTWDVDPGNTGNEGTCTVGSRGQNQNLILCEVGTLGPSDGAAGGADEVVVTINVSASPEACEDGVDNTASVSASNESRLDGRDNDSVEVHVAVNCPDISVESSAADDEIDAGDEAQYTLTLTAGGTGDSTGVVLTDDLPNGQRWAISDGSNDAVDDLAGCTVDEGTLADSNGTLSCEYGDLQNGASRSLVLTAVTDTLGCSEESDNTGTIENSVSGNSGNDKDNENNSHGPVQIDVFCSDLRIDKEARRTDNSGVVKHPGNDVAAGESFRYLITVENRGPGAATGVVITDDLDDGLAIDSASYDIDPEPLGLENPNIGQDGTCDVDTTTNVVTCDIGDALTASDGNEGHGNQEPDDVRVTIEVTTTAANCPLIENQASVDGSNEPSELAADNVSDADPGRGGDHAGAQPWVVAVDCDALVVNKTPDGDAINAGDPAEFTIDVINQADAVAGDIVLNDELPQLAGGGAWTIASDTFDECSLEADETTDVQTLTCTEDSIGPEAEDESDMRSVTVTADTTPDDCGSIVNEDGDMSVTTSRGDPVIPDGGEIVVECPDLAISKSAADETVDAGDDVAFEMSVTNITEGDAYEVVLSDTLPAISGTWTVSGDNAADCDPVVDNQLTCSFGTLGGADEEGAGGGVASIVVTATTSEDDCGDIENTASAAASNEATDELTQSDNAATALATVECPDDTEPPTGGQLPGRSTPRPQPTGGTTPNTSSGGPPPELLGYSLLLGLGSLWFLGRSVIAERRRRGV